MKIKIPVYVEADTSEVLYSLMQEVGIWGYVKDGIEGIEIDYKDDSIIYRMKGETEWKPMPEIDNELIKAFGLINQRLEEGNLIERLHENKGVD